MLREAIVTCCLPGTVLGNGVGGEIHPLPVGAVQVTADHRETGMSRKLWVLILEASVFCWHSPASDLHFLVVSHLSSAWCLSPFLTGL